MIHTRLKECSAEPKACSIDPITAMAGGLFAGLMGGSSGGDSAPAPAAPPPMAPPVQKPQAKQSQQQPSFMGGIPAPPPVTGQKTLLGE